MVADREFR